MALISFDLDGVLQRNPFHGTRPDGVFGHLSRELMPDDPKTGLQLIYDEHTRRLHAGHLVEAHDWDGIVATVAARVNYTGTISVTQLVTEYCDKPNMVWHYLGAPEILQALRDAGHTLVMLTNGFRCYQEPVVRKIGLWDFFTAMISPEMAGAAKPEPGIYRVAEAYGSGPFIHIGDTLPHDVAGAKRSGWKAIYVVQPGAPGATELPPDLAALAPWERPAAGMDWLRHRFDLDRRWHGFPPAELEECIPDAIVAKLPEIPETVSQLVSRQAP
ncbi:MAG TPA: HAD family hydrolase [Symbiobacteriaceae bacterium]|nr:HAD family hydrolase [Symbiobacteriaceae bacterium]